MARVFQQTARMEAPEPGFNIYRVRYDGAQMELIEKV